MLERVLSSFLKYKMRIIGSGRTDAGVHASEQSAHFTITNRIVNKDEFINSVNFFLRKYTISVLNIITFAYTHL